MGRVARFEDLVAWQKALDLAVAVYETTRQGPFRTDFGLSGQMQRAAVSIPSNIAEGFERGGRAEFHQFLSTAKGSSGELRSQLHVASRIGYLSSPDFVQLLDRAEEVARIVGGLRSAVQRQRDAQRPKR
jgi:four helix bundle protein